MKEITYEHDAGVELLPEEIRHNLKKEQLRQAMGWTKEQLKDKIDEVKHFFEAHKKHIIRAEPCVGIWDQHDRDTYLDKMKAKTNA